MPQVVREDTGDQTAVLTVTVSREDYAPKFETELDKYRKKAHMKGFRRGKTPLSVVRKMYGRAVLADIVNQLLQEELYRYLTGEDIEILGQPLPAADQEAIDFDLKEPSDYVFRFDIGLAPRFEVQGVSAGDTYHKYQAEITDAMIDEELTRMRKQHGERLEVEEDIRQGDLLSLRAVELRDGEVLEGGVESTFSLLVDNIDDDDARREILSRKAGDTLRLNLFTLEKNTGEKYVRKFMLKLDDEDEREVGQEFDVTIQEVTRIEPAELDQDFFDKVFGEDTVHSEEDARERIRADISLHYENQAEALLFRDFQEGLMAGNDLPLPDGFLRRWLKANNENLSEEAIEREYDSFARNLKWSLIRGKLVRQFNVEVTREDVQKRFEDRIRGYFGGGPVSDDLVSGMAQRMLENRQQFENTYEDLLTDRLHEAIEARVTVERRPIGVEEFNDILDEARAEAERSRLSQVQLDNPDEEE